MENFFKSSDPWFVIAAKVLGGATVALALTAIVLGIVLVSTGHLVYMR